MREGGESTRVLLTRSTHWKLTNSTTMTFATRVKTLAADKPVWWWHTRRAHPEDFRIFRHLTRRRFTGPRRRLVSPIRGYSTHAEVAWLTPLVDWVERGAAPDRLIATLRQDGKPIRTRPLCAYPMVAKFTAGGNKDDAASFTCTPPAEQSSR